MNVEDAIRAAAAAGPAYAGDLTAIQRRGRRYARRRTAVKAGAVTAVLGVGSTAFLATVPDHTVPPVPATRSASPAASVAPSPSAPPVALGWPSDQRLVIHGPTSWVLNDVEIDAGLSYSSMMRPDGKIIVHRFGADARNSIDGFVPLPDGRFVVLRTVNVGSRTGPDPAHPDGVSNPDIRTRLQILDSKEKVKRSHEVRRAGESVQLLAATADYAYLGRPQGVVRHDFATGRETLILSAGILGADLSAAGPDLRVSLEGNRLAVAKGDLRKPQTVDVFDLSTATRIVSYPLTGVAATFAGPLRVSPDGTRVAVLYRTARDSRLAVLDLATQALVLDQTLADPRDPYAALGRFEVDEHIRGVAWSDDRTLRIAWAQLPPGAHGKHIFNKITTMRTIAVG